MPVTGQAFVNAAARYLGVPYVWGGESPKGFDCSGLVAYVLGQLGIPGVPRTSEAQWAWTQHISQSQLQPGDLIFEQWPGEASPGHVAIYAGNGQIIQAPAPGLNVQRVAWSPSIVHAQGGQIVGYGRVPSVLYSGAPSPVLASAVTAADTTGIVGAVTGALGAAGTLVHDVAETLNFALEFFKPGQMWRVGMGAGAVAAGVGAVRLYRSPSAGAGQSAEVPLAILLTGAALTAGYMAFRPWPLGSGGAPIRPAAYVHEIFGGHPPAGPPAPNDTGAIEAGLWAVAGIWAASKVAGGLGAVAGGIGGIIGGIINALKGLGRTVGEVPIE